VNNGHALPKSPGPFSRLLSVAPVVFKTDQPGEVEGKRVARLNLSAREGAVSVNWWKSGDVITT
jgi:hypothetical protein